MEIKKEYKIESTLCDYYASEREETKITFTEKEIENIIEKISFDIDKLWKENTEETTEKLDDDQLIDEILTIIYNNFLFYKNTKKIKQI